MLKKTTAISKNTADYVPPRTELETQLANLWKELLGIDNVGIHDNFFDIGGDSLYLTMAVNRLREIHKREIPMTDFFQYPTISQLATHLDQDQSPTSENITGMNRAEKRKAARQRKKRPEHAH